jgi:hypothetical protein
VAAVTAGLSWQLYQQDCRGSCTSRTVMAAVPAGLSWQLYQQDCRGSCTRRTAMAAVQAVIAWQLYQQTAISAVHGGRTVIAGQS